MNYVGQELSQRMSWASVSLDEFKVIFSELILGQHFADSSKDLIIYFEMRGERERVDKYKLFRLFKDHSFVWDFLQVSDITWRMLIASKKECFYQCDT